MKKRLTKRTVAQATYQGSGRAAFYIWDTQDPGLGLRVYPSGRKAFVVTYFIRGVQRFHTLGRVGEMALDEARLEAQECRTRARRGDDPGARRRADRDAPTVADLAERYMAEHAHLKKKASTARRDQQLLKIHVLPRLGKRRVADITRDDTARLHAEMAAVPTQANHARSILSKAFNLAEVWGWRPEGSNPCRGIKPYKQASRERYLSESEITRLGEALDLAERTWGFSSQAIAALRLLVLTGCRKSEILTLRWDYVDVERRCLHLPDSKTGRKTVRLNSAALDVLTAIERVEGNPFVVPGAKEGTHLSTLDNLWDRVRREAQIEDVRLHDLRHTFASFGVNRGLNLPVIGKLLGHARITTTQRYAHLADDPVRNANEAIGGAIAAGLSGQVEPKDPR